jgi:hypothetical protein
MMPMDFRHDQESRMLAGLAAHEPERQCSDRIRGRCHVVLLAERRRAEVASIPAQVRSWRHVFESAVVAVVCAVYLSEVVRRAMALYGL